jgi:UDPglucose 6-dehydrogenase
MSADSQLQTPITHISVIGTGYLGAVHAACMASIGYTVVGIDTDEKKIASLNSGISPFYEPGFDDLLAEQIESGRLSFTTSFAAAASAQVHFICVGTPQREDGLAANLDYLYDSVNSLLPFATTGSVIAGKSTVPVGTAAALREMVKKHSDGIDLVWNPEFLREGFAVEDTLNPTRLVLGSEQADSEGLLRKLYAFNIENKVPWVSTDLPTAELVKVAANSFLATKISFINAMAEICEIAGGDVVQLATAIGYDPRIGNRFLQAGIGFGGGCLPKDIRAFMARAQELGAQDSLEFLREIDEINNRARSRAAELVKQELGMDPKSKKIAVLGGAFKPDSDDVRDSPALDIAEALRSWGAQVHLHDPKAIEGARKRFPHIHYSEDLTQVLSGADIVLHLTEWKMYRELDPAKVKTLVKHPVIIDGRNMLNASAWQSAGWRFVGLGRSIKN